MEPANRTTIWMHSESLEPRRNYDAVLEKGGGRAPLLDASLMEPTHIQDLRF